MITLTDLQKVELAIAPVDAMGNAAPVEGVPVWVSSDPAVVAVTPSPDGMTCVAVTVGPIGTAQITVSADADLGPGVATITGVLDVQVIASQAVSLAVTAGVPTEK